MAKKLLYAMRHCETLFNVQHKSQGWCDSPVTKRGIEQCHRAGEELARRGITFDHFYTSTSERCCDTMEHVCETAFGKVFPYVRLKGLRECGFGIFEAKDDFLEPDFGPARSKIMAAAGGESDEEIDRRITSCMQGIMSDPECERALVVGSAGSLRHFFECNRPTLIAVGSPRPSNCMTYVYEWEDGVFSCIELYVPDFSGLDETGVAYRYNVDL